MTRAGALAGGLWLCMLGLSLALSGRNALRRADTVPEYAHGCDRFGYLTMAREVRRAAARGSLPDFHMATPRPGVLAAHLASLGVPRDLWYELVAPHAHHWFPSAGAVGPQYPPGTAALLALFPEGRAARTG